MLTNNASHCQDHIQCEKLTLFPEVFHISFQTQIQIGADEPSFYSYRDMVQYVSKSPISENMIT